MSQDDQPDLATAGLDFTSTIHNDTYPFISSSTSSNLSGRALLVTGAANGIGKAIALSAARAGASEIALADVAFFPSSTEEELCDVAKESGEPPPSKILLLDMDITESEQIAQAARTVEQEFGRLDVLVNNAGRFETYQPLLDSDPGSYWKTFEVNLCGTIEVTRAFLPLILRSKPTASGHEGLKTVISMSSVGALTASTGGGGAYRISKLAILRFIEFLHYDYRMLGLLAYCVHPGAVKTALGFGLPKEMQARLIDEPALPGDCVVWLCQERREWLGGRYLSCTWDMEEFMERKKEILQEDKLRFRMAF